MKTTVQNHLRRARNFISASLCVGLLLALAWGAVALRSLNEVNDQTLEGWALAAVRQNPHELLGFKPDLDLKVQGVTLIKEFCKKDPGHGKFTFDAVWKVTVRTAEGMSEEVHHRLSVVHITRVDSASQDVQVWPSGFVDDSYVREKGWLKGS